MLASYTMRTALTFATGLTRPKVGLLSEVAMPFFAWPTDIDLYGHINNGRYLTLMDFGRLEHSLRTGFASALLRSEFQPVAANAQIRFRAEVFPFSRCVLQTRLRAWDDKRVYYAQRIERKGRVCAEADIEIAFRGKKGTVSLAEVFERLGRPMPPELQSLRVADGRAQAPQVTRNDAVSLQA